MFSIVFLILLFSCGDDGGEKKDMEEELDLSRPRFSLEEAMESDLIKSTRKDIKRRIVTEQRRMTNSSNDTDY